MKKDTSVIHALTATEVHSMRVILRSQAGASVISRQFLYLSSKYLAKRKKFRAVNSIFYSGEAKVGTTYSGSSVDKVIEAINKASGLKLKEDDLQIEEETDSSQCEGSSCLTVNINPHFVEFNLKLIFFFSFQKQSVN